MVKSAFDLEVQTQKSVELQLIGTRGIARHPHTKQEQPTQKRGRLALILVCIRTGDFLVPKSKAKRLRILFYKKYIIERLNTIN